MRTARSGGVGVVAERTDASRPALDVRIAAIVAGDRAVVRDATLTLMPRDVAVVSGPNGCGKSSLLKALLGEIPAELVFAHPAGRRDLRGLVGYLPQHDGVDVSFPFSVDEIVAVAGRSREDEDLALAATGAAAMRRRALSELSGGERRRVFLARTLLFPRPLLFLDEPTAAVDHASAGRLYAAVAEHAATYGAAAIVVAHDADVAAEHATLRLRIADGRMDVERLRPPFAAPR